MANVNKDFMDGFATALVLVDISQRDTSNFPLTKVHKLLTKVLDTWKYVDKETLDPGSLKEALEKVYRIKIE